MSYVGLSLFMAWECLGGSDQVYPSWVPGVSRHLGPDGLRGMRASPQGIQPLVIDDLGY